MASLLSSKQASRFDQQHNRHDDKDHGVGGLGINHFGQALNQAQAKARKELEKNVVVAEAAIATAELKLKNLTIELEKPQTDADGGRALRLNRDVMATQEEIARLTEAWEKALARVEATNSAD